ncbi:MAG: hypothetical protein ACI9P9_000742 [Patescibacteria group bacterium]|jgi:hypothetical protein
MDLSRKQLLLVTLLILFGMVITFIPHLVTQYPLHIDEWHHITKASELRNGDYLVGISTSEIGFHFVLLILSFLIPLVKSYMYLPSIYLAFTSLVLFSTTFRLHHKRKYGFMLSFFSVLFFIFIKSNINTLGSWFFTPLIFAVPFIYLYLYFFVRAFQTKNKQLLLYTLFTMILLIFTHAPSVLAFLPAMIWYAYSHRSEIDLFTPKYILTFSLIPVIGLLFYSYFSSLNVFRAFLVLIYELLFWESFSTQKFMYSPTAFYSSVAFIFAFIGILRVLKNAELRKAYQFQLYWMTTLLTSLLIYGITGISFLSPYRRNLFYLAMGLVFFSALGLQTSFVYIGGKIKRVRGKRIIQLIFMVLVLLSLLIGFFSIPAPLKLYNVFNDDSHEAVSALSDYPTGKVMAPLNLAVGIYPISSLRPVATFYFYGHKSVVESFYAEAVTCTERETIIRNRGIDYVMSYEKLNCSWEILYDSGGIVTYDV